LSCQRRARIEEGGCTLISGGGKLFSNETHRDVPIPFCDYRRIAADRRASFCRINIGRGYSIAPKSGCRFSAKAMRKQKPKANCPIPKLGNVL
jgi:hypothetical protein